MNGQIELKVQLPDKDKPTSITVKRVFPEDFLDDLVMYLGDGKARVSLSCDMSTKDFGKGAGVSVSISVSCGQNEESVNQVVKLLGVKTRALAREQLVLAGAEYNALMDSNPPEWK